MSDFFSQHGVLLVVLDLVISGLNAWGVGRDWAFRSYASAWHRFVMYSTAVASAAGFTWVYLYGLTYGAYGLRHQFSWLSWMTQHHVDLIMTLGYVIIGPAIAVTGVVITLDMSFQTIRSRRPAELFANGLVTGYDLVAVYDDLIGLADFLPDALRAAWDFIKPGDTDPNDDSNPIVDWFVKPVILGTLFLTIFGGILTTARIIKVTSGRQVDKRFARRAPDPPNPFDPDTMWSS